VGQQFLAHLNEHPRIDGVSFGEFASGPSELANAQCRQYAYQTFLGIQEFPEVTPT